MQEGFTPTQLTELFPSDEACLDEIKKLRYPQGIPCGRCYKITKHYKLAGRSAYSCEYCRHQVYPLRGTIFEKSSTSLRLWFFCMYLMTTTRGKISVIQLQQQLDVTYKTAWRMRKLVLRLMKQHRGDLLAEPERTISFSFFNAFELRVVEKQEKL